MTARLDIRWTEDLLEQEAVSLHLVRQITRPKPHLRCPECNSILYARRHKLCGVCGKELPETLLLTHTEASQVKELLNAERQKHRDWMRKNQ